MMTIAFQQAFFAVWLLAISYVAAFFTLILRVNWLFKRGRAPGVTEPLKFGGFGNTFGLLKYLFSARYRDLDDRLVTGLIWATRAMFVIYLPAFAWVAWLAPTR